MPQFDIVILGLQTFGLFLSLYFFYLYNITVIEIGIMEKKKISCFFLFFFMSLFFHGNPYFSLIIILGCFILYNWYYTKLTINSKFFLIFNIFIVTFLFLLNQIF
jgi:hypothetical protein